MSLVMEMNDKDLYTKEARIESGDVSKISLDEIQKKSRKRMELSQSISEKTLELLMMFREYGRSPELFIERKERVLEVSGMLNYQRHDVLRKIEKRDAFRKILLGMRRCGQTTYYEIIWRKIRLY